MWFLTDLRFARDRSTSGPSVHDSNLDLRCLVLAFQRKNAAFVLLHLIDEISQRSSRTLNERIRGNFVPLRLSLATLRHSFPRERIGGDFRLYFWIKETAIQSKWECTGFGSESVFINFANRFNWKTLQSIGSKSDKSSLDQTPPKAFFQNHVLNRIYYDISIRPKLFNFNQNLLINILIVNFTHLSKNSVKEL